MNLAELLNVKKDVRMTATIYPKNADGVQVEKSIDFVLDLSNMIDINIAAVNLRRNADPQIMTREQTLFTPLAVVKGWSLKEAFSAEGLAALLSAYPDLVNAITQEVVDIDQKKGLSSVG